VISARVVRAGEVSTGLSPSDRWVWIFVVQGVFAPASCGGYSTSAERCTIAATTELAIFDYLSGEFLEARVPAYP
jgi:hypothetical protein